MKVIKLIIYLPIGLFLYVFNKNFRSLVNRKIKPAGTINETVGSGEEVVAVLKGPDGNRVLEGPVKRSWLSRYLRS